MDASTVTSGWRTLAYERNLEQFLKNLSKIKTDRDFSVIIMKYHEKLENKVTNEDIELALDCQILFNTNTKKKRGHCHELFTITKKRYDQMWEK